MADLSKIKLNGTEYDLKDAVARSNISALENAGYQNQAQVNSAIATAIGNINQFEVAIVTDLPTTDIDAHTIYFKSNSSSGNNIYDEYMYINSSWEIIGNTAIDLSNYLQTSDIADWAKQANKPTYTASEVGALSSFYLEKPARVEPGQYPGIQLVLGSNYSIKNQNDGIIQTFTMPSVPSWALQSTKPTYTASEVGALPDTTAIPTVPSNISAFTNDVGYISSYNETDPVFTASAAAEISSTDISNWNAKSDFSGSYNDLTDKPTIPEDKLFLINVTMTSLTSGTSDKSSTEIATAVNAGKLPIVKASMDNMSMMATLVNIEETQENEETYYAATFIYNDENTAHTNLPAFITKAVMIISGTQVTLQVKRGSYITDRELNEKGYLTSYTETDPIFTASAAANITLEDIVNWNAKSDFSGSYNDLTDQPTIPDVPTWALESTKPTYTANEVGALPSTYTAPVTSVNGQTGEVNLTIPAAQVQSDWNATSGMGVILNKPTIPVATTVTNTLASGTLIATINGTNIYAPAYTDADGVSY